MSSVNLTGSRGEAPYTDTELCTTSLRNDSAFWHAASSCMVPMTLISFMEERPAVPGLATMAMWTTVSTPRLLITLPMTGLRMSARTKETLPRSCRGGLTSTPMTSRVSSVARARANRAPRSRETPVTRTTRDIEPTPWVRAATYPARRRWMRVFLSSLRCFFFAIRLRRFLMTEPTVKDLSMCPQGGRDPVPLGAC